LTPKKGLKNTELRHSICIASKVIRVQVSSFFREAGHRVFIGRRAYSLLCGKWQENDPLSRICVKKVCNRSFFKNDLFSVRYKLAVQKHSANFFTRHSHMLRVPLFPTHM